MANGSKPSWFNTRLEISEDAAGIYQQKFENLTQAAQHSLLGHWLKSLHFKYDFSIKGYFQSWKYFINDAETLRNTHFILQPHMFNQVQSFFNNVKTILASSVASLTRDKNYTFHNGSTHVYITKTRGFVVDIPMSRSGPNYRSAITQESNNSVKDTDNSTLYIGLHVRRGDMVLNQNYRNFGYKVASRDYIIKAMRYFRNKFSSRRIVFIACTDDTKWFVNHIFGATEEIIVLSLSTDPGLDLGILSNCNHSIITVGSFGWWGAYFAGGTTVYCKDWPTPGSELEHLVKKEDYFLPNWIAL